VVLNIVTIIRWLEWPQTFVSARKIAALVACAVFETGLKFTTAAGSVQVDGATHLMPDPATQCYTARLHIIRAEHSTGVRIDFFGQIFGDFELIVEDFGRIK
jgi:hypothetical protein